MNIIDIIKGNILIEGWYHGSPDAREIEKQGGFTSRSIQVDYIPDPNGLMSLEQKIQSAWESGDQELYLNLLDEVPSYKEKYKYIKPLFLTNKGEVAKTYADPKRAFDYQGAKESVYEVEVDCNRVVEIHATNDRFRFIGVDKVRKGFIDAGVSEDEIDSILLMFNYYSRNKGIQTDTIAAIGNWLSFDCIDVIGVLDSYHGGSTQSTVRMVLDPSKVKIKRSV